MKIIPLAEKDMLEVISWKYAPPYEHYNYPSLETLKEEGWAIIDKLKRKEQFRACYENELIGYIRLQLNTTYITLGLGFKPNYCGKGNGKAYMTSIISYIMSNYPNITTIKLSVLKFNLRAINCYKSVNFKIVDEDEYFYFMELHI